MMDIFVARQPIFDRNLRCVAYELLFRDGISSVMNHPDGDAATLELLSHSFLSIGLETLTHQKNASSILPRICCSGSFPLPFPRKPLWSKFLKM